MKPETLDALTDAELQAVIARCEELLKARDEERKAKAVSDARARLASVGLTFRDVANGKSKRPVKSPAYQAGVIYQHPSDKALTWNAKGKKPGWLLELESHGVKPLEASPANDVPQVKKAG